MLLLEQQAGNGRRDMAQETNQGQAPLLCSTGCGFYGSPRNDGMCSVCYKDFLQRQNTNGCVGPPASSSDSSDEECFHTVASQTATSPEDVESGPRSGLSTASAEERTSGATRSVTAESLPGSSVRVLVSEQEAQCSAASSGTRSATGRKCFHKGKKRKVQEDHVSVDVKRASADASAEPEEKPKAKKSRCFTCRKKVGFPEFYCRCGEVFCSAHRYSDVHNCTFDYKAEAAEKLRKENPVIVGEKIQRI